VARTGRAILAVLAGAVVWAVLWVGGTKVAQMAIPAALPAGQPVTDTGVLVALILYSVVLSILAGFVTARVASGAPAPAVRGLAVLQLVLGVGIEASAWSLTPVWYHIVFLVMLVPATIYGGRLAVRRGSASPTFAPSR
jgi:hypothetical protein